MSEQKPLGHCPQCKADLYGDGASTLAGAKELHLTKEQEKVLEGAFMDARTLKRVYAASVKDQLATLERAGVEKFVAKTFGRRCKTKDVHDFPELVGDPKATRCAACEMWEIVDEYFGEKNED